MALIATEFRRDALIAPSGCGQYRGGEGRGYSARGAGLALCQMSSLALMSLRPHGVYGTHTHTHREEAQLGVYLTKP